MTNSNNVQNNSTNIQHPNPLIDPLVRYHGRVVGIITFKSLPENDKINEIVLRIVTFITIPLGYLALGFLAIVGITLDCCSSSKQLSSAETAHDSVQNDSKAATEPLSNKKKKRTKRVKVNPAHAANDSVMNASKVVKPLSHNTQTRAKVPANIVAVHTVATTESDSLESKLKAIYQTLISYCPETHLKAHRAADNKIKFGKTQTGVIYIETENRDGKPRHFDITPSGTGSRLDARYGTANFNPALQIKLNESDLSLINWAVSKILAEQSAGSKTLAAADKATSFGNDRNSMRVPGHVIPSNVQEAQIGDYNWKQAYSTKAREAEIQKAMPRMQEFVQQADSAVIAYKGTLSNFQRKKFVDPISKKEMRSAEHMFQMYKFSDKHSIRSTILQQATPADALTAAKQHAFFLKDGVLKAWIDCNLNLMVFVQLAKALESKTGLKDDLLASGKDFIIEDTSSKRLTRFSEKFWGDNGDGSGNNQLGYAQMVAREIVKDPTFSEQTVVDFYTQHVKPKLLDYYQLTPQN
jgi:predicted NAD-dependent protein-ADP-ribosyltransferase YbiA (DUF1768 family)